MACRSILLLLHVHSALAGYEVPLPFARGGAGTICSHAPAVCDGTATDSTTEVTLSSNGLSGTLPTELLTLSKLKTLDLGENYLSGTLPAWLGRMTTLDDLNVRNNWWISGTVPTQLGEQRNLSNNLQLWFNRMSGTYPVQLTQLHRMKGIFLEGNYLSGTLPSEVGLLSNGLTHNLGQSFNYLSGFIPTQIGRLSKLQRCIQLNVNRLSGTLPQELAQLTKIGTTDWWPPGAPAPCQGLDLYSNLLSGTVPDAFLPQRPPLLLQGIVPGRTEHNRFTGVRHAALYGTACDQQGRRCSKDTPLYEYEDPVLAATISIRRFIANEPMLALLAASAAMLVCYAGCVRCQADSDRARDRRHGQQREMI